MKKPVIINILVIFLTPWWWHVIQTDLLIGLLIFVQSILLFLFILHPKLKIAGAILILTAIVAVSAVTQAFDETILRLSALDIQQLTRRHEFYASGLKKIYTNRISLAYFNNIDLPLNKIERNYFENLDINLYFFATHPRERVGIDEFEKYLVIFLPFFILGLFYTIYLPYIWIIVYLLVISLVSTFISPKYNLGPVLFFPVINFMITFGILLSISKLKTLKKRISSFRFRSK